MAFNKLTANMMVDDVAETVDFYRDVLGFNLIMTVPERNPFDWALMKRGDVEMMFQARAGLTEMLPLFAARLPGGALILYIDIEDVDALYEQIRAQVPVVQALRTTFYGTREFAIEDCNGFILTFAEDE